MKNIDIILSGDPVALEEYYRIYKTEPESLDLSWRYFFMGMELSRSNGHSNYEISSEDLEQNDCVEREARVVRMIEGYRSRGHLFTKTNPVRTRRKYESPLTLESFNISSDDENKVFKAGEVLGLKNPTLKQIVEHLEKTYCSSVAIEYRYLRDPSMIRWLERKMESTAATPSFNLKEKKRIFSSITRAVAFEKFLHTRFIGQKRFSVEGVESMIPALDMLVEKGAELGIREIVIGMAHRGRLNVLGNILGKPYHRIFYEFQGSGSEIQSGDVRYHLGFSADRETLSGKTVHLSLCSNPSHLEAVDSVVEGVCRARLDIRHENDENRIAPVLIHGDAAMAGQGVVYEVIQMSRLPGYRTGGTVHIVLNNQLGFTTNYLEGRSSTYCTDVGKTTLSPVFHVNGDDVEAVSFTMQLALEFRQKFHQDVFIDILGYRKHGHNESDEPRFTQPLLYDIIEKHPDTAKIYREQLLKEKSFTESEMDAVEQEFREKLEAELEQSKNPPDGPPNSYLKAEWKEMRLAGPEDFLESPITGVSADDLEKVSDALFHLPDGKPIFAKIRKLFETKHRQFHEKSTVDWSTAEGLAFGTLLLEGYPVRMSGQDSRRGTFSQRHSVLTLEQSEEVFIPLEHVSDDQARFQIYNSPLSEYGVLGYEFGYSMAHPMGLTVWEAQFGDFVNGAQTIIDEFITASEEKWQRMSGLVLMLPHGFEGQGPDHSSARMERFLELAVNGNIQVASPSTPAGLYHILRRQLHRPFRKPLILFTPKSLLRHPRCVSSVHDMTENTRFHEVLGEEDLNPDSVKKILICTGKIYYDLLLERERRKDQTTSIFRLEQLHPFPQNALQKLMEPFAGKPVVWVQEEPENMGALNYIRRVSGGMIEKAISRPPSASPATGYSKNHENEQKELMERAFHDSGENPGRKG